MPTSATRTDPARRRPPGPRRLGAARGAAALALAGAALARSPAALADEPSQAGGPPAGPPAAPAAPVAYPPGVGQVAYSPAELPELPAWANPRTIEYEEGDPILPGYALRTRPSKGLLLGGLITAASAYGISLVIGSVALSAEGSNDEIAPMLIPIVGPFVTISTADAAGAGTFWLAVDGALQIGGVLMVAAAFASEDFYLERQFETGGGGGRVARAPARPTAALRPAVSIGPGSAALRWRF